MIALHSREKKLLTVRLSGLTEQERQRLFERSSSLNEDVRQKASGIISEVRQKGDGALRTFARQFDGVQLDSLGVPRRVAQEALASLNSELRRALERTQRNLESVQRAFLPASQETSPEPGVRVGRRPDPLDRVGVYAPGGRAVYPSSVLMGAVPARVAGVREIILCSPPGANGLPSPVVLAAAEIAGVDRIFAVGGAGAIAAMAYGTESIPRVDRIVGPGNAYVAEAKLQVTGAVSIDSPAGPSELLVVADASADVQVIAREVMAQAEHDPQAVVVVAVIGEEAAVRISSAIERAIDAEPRASIIRESLAERGAVLAADSIDECAEFAACFAPEHLLLALADAGAALPRFRNAGTIFVGARSSVAFGDYMTGANHVLPTGGLARSYSGLSVLDFIRWTTYQEVSAEAAARLASDVGVLADAEGLPAHAAAARQWLDGTAAAR